MAATLRRAIIRGLMPVKRSSKSATERAGVSLVSLRVEQDLGWIFREQPIVDVGIDAHVEMVESDTPTGALIGLQIKTGPSWFKEQTSDGMGIVFRGDLEHLEYWLGHSLPVVLVLVDPSTQDCFWQTVNPATAERTGTGWKLVVPKAQRLDVSTAPFLKAVVSENSYRRGLSQLVIHKPWIELASGDGELLLEADEWVNKSSGRGSLRLISRDTDGNESVVQDWPFVMFPGMVYADILEHLFPWALMVVDEEKYDEAEQGAWSDECGAWDNEEGEYLFHTKTLSEWQQSRPRIRPYEVEAGELARFKLVMVPNALGEGFLALDRFLSTGQPPNPHIEDDDTDYRYGLKAAAQRVGVKIKMPGDPDD